jgi:dTDP-4-amino-4,6-dideoxygalactose transaminase
MAIARQRIRLPQGAWRTALASLLRGDLWHGDSVKRFEHDFAEYISASDAVAVPSGRAGFRFLFDALELEPGGEVICSAFGYPIVPFIVKSLGYDLKFVDCEMGTLGMDPALLADACTDKTQAVIATHLYGVPCRIEEIAAICADHGVALIEDCAHCVGASVGGRRVGSFGAAGCFSFETSKVINTMGGGMVTLADPEVAGRLRELAADEPRNGMKWLLRRLLKTSFEAAVTHPVLFNLGVYQALRVASSGTEDDRFASGYQGDEVSLKGKMGRYTNYQARLGLRQLQTVDARNRRRTANAERLIGQLDGAIPLQKPASTGDGNFANYMLVTVLSDRLRALAAALLKRGVDSKHLYMRDCSRMFDGQREFPNAARAEREVLHVPSYPEMTKRQVDRVARGVRDALQDLAASAA